MTTTLTTDRTADFFDRYARDFDAIYGTRNTPVHRIINTLFRGSMRKRYMMSLEGCEPIRDRTVLDIGCGPGHYSVELARRGAARVLGIDFADGMLDIARQSATRASVQDRCEFRRADFFKDSFDETFDYVIAMGFMDYVADPKTMIVKALGLARSRAFFSFPLAGGLLALQRQLRYRSRCDLYLYTENQVRALFANTPAKRVDVVQADRDLFVTAHLT
jgi:2-polyprenyl-3-methyl-5-hydroxy-6-metoxy-1,4-benzoquinol methylase